MDQNVVEGDEVIDPDIMDTRFSVELVEARVILKVANQKN